MFTTIADVAMYDSENDNFNKAKILHTQLVEHMNTQCADIKS